MPTARAPAANEQQAQPAILTVEEMTDVWQIYRYYKQEATSTGDNITNAELMELAKFQFESNKGTAPVPAPTPAPAVNPSDSIIPRDVSDNLKGMPKLNKENWHAWHKSLQRVLRAMPIALQILDGTIVDTDADYDLALDQRLVGVLENLSEREGSKNILYILNQDDWQTGSQLFEVLEEELTKTDMLSAGAVLTKLGRVKMYNDDVEKVIHQINEIATEGAMVGNHVEDKQKIQAIATATQFSDTYSEAWSTLETIDRETDWRAVCTALLKRQRRQRNTGLHRGPRAAALVSGEKKTEASAEAKPREERAPLTKDEAYLLGKRDPSKPDEPAKCYNCGQPGHIAINCPKPKRERKGPRESAALATDHQDGDKTDKN
jgi:hypothetical protein